MENGMIAYCGLNCAGCPAYLATQANDREALEQVVAKLREEYDFDHEGFTADNVLCNGCVGQGRTASYCSECEIRACGIEHGVVNCAYCDDYACEKLESFLAQVPTARQTLDALRDTL